MKFKKKALLFLTAIFAVATLYFFSSWTSLQTELQLTPEWTSDITKTPDGTSGERALPFRLGNKAGYFTHSGKISLLENVPYKATLSRDFYSIYNQDEESAALYNSNGSKRCNIRGAGFPFIQQDRVFLFLPGGSSIAFVNNVDGRLDTIYEHTSPVTAFNSSAQASVAGFADGRLLVFDKYGIKKIEVFPGGSDLPVILGADISKSGKTFACVSGKNPQRFVVYSDEGSYEKIIFHEFLEKGITRQTYVHFSSGENFVYYDSGDSLGIVDLTTLTSTHVPVSGKVLDIEESPVADSVYVLSRKDSTYTVTVFQDWNKKVGDFSFDGRAAFILADGNTLFVGRDSKISRLTISKN